MSESDAKPRVQVTPEQITNAYLKKISDQIADHTRLMESKAEYDLKLLRAVNDQIQAFNTITRSRIINSPVSAVMWGAFFGIFVLPFVFWVLIVVILFMLGVSIPLIGGV